MTSLALPRARKSARPVIDALPLVVREETRGDAFARDALLDATMGPARFTKSSERVRAGRKPARGLALVALLGGEIVGTVRLWNIDAGGVPALLLGPLAVSEKHRTLGVGGALMRSALRRAKARGHKAVLLVGDAPYYARFGFSSELTRALVMPGPVDAERFLALEFEPGALAEARGMVTSTGEPVARRALRLAA